MNSNLISKNISGYFDELINKPIITPPPKQSTMSSFYKNYVEHNLLLIIIIIFIIIFLLFKYFSKNYYNDNIENDEKIDKNKKEKERKKIDKEREFKLRQKIQKERQLLEKEKSEILSIIDELSEINYKRVIPQTIKEENIQPLKKENQINYNNIDYEAYTNNENYSDDYYDIKGNKSELIDGVYFETPYN
jgi:uncharacterized membrane protein